MPAAVHGHAVTSGGGFIYSASGTNIPPGGGGNVDLLQRYDPVTDTWTTSFALVPIPVVGATLAYDTAGGPDGPRLFLFGGGNVSGTILSLVQVYTFSTNSWTTGPSLPDPRAGMGKGAFGGVVYLVGGLNSAGVAQSQNWEFNFATGTYNTVAPLPLPRARAGAAVSGGKLYVISGRDAAGNLVDTNYEYTPPPVDMWTPRAVISTMVAGPGATVLGAMTAECDGDIIIVGGGTPFFTNDTLPRGQSREPESTNISQLYDVASDSWSAGPTLPTARFSLRAAQAGDTLIAFGGWDGLNTVTTVDRIQGPPLPVELQGFRVE